MKEQMQEQQLIKVGEPEVRQKQCENCGFLYEPENEACPYCNHCCE
jgi:uncharacterized OB-fold protein